MKILSYTKLKYIFVMIFLCTKSFKVALQYLFNMFITFRTVFYLKFDIIPKM